MRINRKLAAGMLLGLAVATTLPAGAQEIAEIIVTARRQGEEKLMDTPLAITAFDANAIESMGISNLQDVANLTPGLTFFNPFGENLPTPIIRGVVPQDIFGENATAIFVDGVYVAGREGLNFSQLDIERIEVLKGPQSSTYGRNAFSGAINYVTKAPSDVFEAKTEVAAGNRGKQKIMGQISGPIWGESLTGRISAMYDEWDGSYDNSLAPENDIGGYRYRSFQGKLRWRPADSLDINLGIYRSNDEIDESAVGGIAANCEDRLELTSSDADGRPYPRLLGYCGEVPRLRNLPKMLDPGQFPLGVPLDHSVTHDTLPKLGRALGEDRDLVRGHLNIAWTTDHGTLSALTGYSHLEQQSLSDFNRSSGIVPLVYCNTTAPNDPGIPPLCDLNSWGRVPMGWLNIEHGSTVEEWSQELRFTGPRDQRLRWQAGGYYFRSTLEARPGTAVATTSLPGDIGIGGDIAIGPVATGTAFGIGSYIYGPAVAPGADLDPLGRPIFDKRDRSWSLFTSADFDVTDHLEVRAELRYTQDSKLVVGHTYQPCGFIDGTDYPVVTVDPSCGNDFYDLRIESPVSNQSSSERFDYTTGRLGLKYKLDSGWMAYGSVAYGEKPGDVDLSSMVDAILPDGTTTRISVSNNSGPEKITAYELGIKGFTPDRRIGLDLSVFLNDWRDIVLRQLMEVDPATQLQYVQPRAMNVNAGDAHVFGWEVTADVGLTDNLTGRLTTSYTDSVLKKARMDTYALYPSFYTTDPACAPTAIQALPTADQKPQAEYCQSISGDVSDKTQMRQPRWTMSASLDYRRPLFDDWDIKSNISANYADKIFTLNDNQSWIPERTNVNFSIGMESPRYTVTLWVRNLFDNDKPMSAFRDIYFTNTQDLQAQKPLSTPMPQVSGQDDIMPLRMSISYPSLRTFGLTAQMRFGGEER